MQPIMAPDARVIACCVSTLHRPLGLESTLRSIADQRASLPAHVRLLAIVVSNDPDDPAPAEIVTRVGRETGLEVLLEAEPRRGVAFPRNRALEGALAIVGNTGLIAFLDDDETAPAGWLATLLAARDHLGPGIVTGPVDPSFQVPPPQWVLDGRFFAAAVHPTGSRRPWAFTNNVLFDASLVSLEEPRFPTSFLRAGEDRHFFQRLARRGIPIHWINEARVIESIPPERATAEWLVRRQRSVGRCVATIERDIRGHIASLSMCTAKGIAWIVIGTARQCAARRLEGTVRARMQRAWGLGLLEGAWVPSTAGHPVATRD
jgi:glycosyltransferase involved in cell wall biosynthesis